MADRHMTCMTHVNDMSRLLDWMARVTDLSTQMAPDVFSLESHAHCIMQEVESSTTHHAKRICALQLHVVHDMHYTHDMT